MNDMQPQLAPPDLVRQEVAASARLIVVKVGTRVLTRGDGTLNDERIARLADELNEQMAAGRKLVLVSSGAVGAGMSQLGIQRRPTGLAHLQAVAAVGQAKLIEAYDRTLRKHGRHAAQVLLTAGDFDDRTRYLNVRNTLFALLEYGAVPIINENDTVSVEELQNSFGDNDRLAAMVTNLLRAPLLVLLSDVEGLYDGDPDQPGSAVIPTVERLDASVFALARTGQAGLGKGGMASKLEAASIATSSGENVIIASGRRPGVLSEIVLGEPVGTLFLAQGHSVTARKRWIGHAVRPRGYLTLDDGARRAIEEQGRSLLAIGIIEVSGEFQKGDVVALRDAQGDEFARGLTNFPSRELLQIQGRKSSEFEKILGHRPYDEVIHRDNLVISGKTGRP
jgi:glutamate 5-kinase